ncbi:hypothetical protein [Vibrio maritimus]|uniref:hypothetical protein n=1 Tax=Vibrio maritimus TaxID=990268 RepID=UPI001F472D00|nr:hypothetical protein [Vibrio maritimus]
MSIKNLILIVSSLFGISSFSYAAVDFVNILNLPTSDINKIESSMARSLLKQQSSIITKRGSVKLTTEEKAKIGGYTTTPANYDIAFDDPLSGDLTGLANNIAFRNATKKLPGAQGIDIYSAQKIGTNGPKPEEGDYVVANGRPWSFTSNEYTAGRFGQAKLSDPVASPTEQVAIYKVNAYSAKPIGGISTISKEVEYVYPSGSAFRVKGVTQSTLKNGKIFSEITLVEVDAVPIDATIIHYKGGMPLTKEAIEAVDIQIRLKTIESEEAEISGATCRNFVS